MRARSVLATAVILAALLLAGSAATVPAKGAPTALRVWGDGVEWEVLIGRSAEVRTRWQPFYVIAPVDASDPQSRGMWGFGPHDQVKGVDHRGGAYTGTCKVLLVVAGPRGLAGVNIEVVPDPDLGVPFVRAVDSDGDGAWEPLTSAGLVERAAASGLVALFEPQPGGAPIAFVCPVRPLRD